MKLNIDSASYTEREKTVCTILESIKDPIKSFINVGFHDWQDPRRHWWIKVCENNNIDWSIVEVYKPNVDDAISKGCPKDNIYNLNIEDVDSLPDADLLMFWHGPEHLLKDNFLKVLGKLEKKYGFLIFGMPLGEEPQGAAYGNPFEKHISSWSTLEWEELGYTVIEVHDRIPAHITVHKDLKG